MSPELKQFYRELQAWIDGGCGEHHVLKSNAGLCENLRLFCEHVLKIKGLRSVVISQEMSAQFMRKGMHISYPFNEIQIKGKLSGRHSFWAEKKLKAMYENPKRLAWIKEHAQ